MSATSKSLPELFSHVFLMKADLHHHIICSSVTLSHILSLLAKSQTLKEISKAERILMGLRVGGLGWFSGVFWECLFLVCGWVFLSFMKISRWRKGRNVQCKINCSICFACWPVSTCITLAKYSRLLSREQYGTWEGAEYHTRFRACPKERCGGVWRQWGEHRNLMVGFYEGMKLLQ